MGLGPGQGTESGVCPLRSPDPTHALLDPGSVLLICLSVQASERHLPRFLNKQVSCGLTGVLGLRSHTQLGSLSSHCSPITFGSPPLSTKYMSLIRKTARVAEKRSLEQAAWRPDRLQHGKMDWWHGEHRPGSSPESTVGKEVRREPPHWNISE